MEERSEESVEAGKRGTSRRTALKLGAGAGVGMIAWSGMSITSLGGTPVYASGCTFVVSVNLLSCRNTTQQTPSQFSYQPLNLDGLPAGYSFDQNVPNNTLCEDNFISTLTFPEGITCAVTIRFNLPGNCSGTSIGKIEYTSNDGTLTVIWACLDPNDPDTFFPPPKNEFPSQTMFQIDLNCITSNPDGLLDDCF